MKTTEPRNPLERRLFAQARAARQPISGSFELTPLCTMDCSMCYVRLSRGEQEAIAPLRTAEEWLSLGMEIRDAGTLFLLLTGGEPLLHPQFREIYLGLQALGLILTVNTNATLIDAQWADFFAAHPPRRLNVTLYGASSATYARLCRFEDGFDRTMHALHLLSQRRLPVKISVSLVRENEHELAQMLAIGRELDMPVHADTYMMPALRERSAARTTESRLSPQGVARAMCSIRRIEEGETGELDFIRRSLQLVRETPPSPETAQPLKCLAGSCSFSVSWQGMLRPCVMLSTPQTDPFSLGFAKAWQQLVQHAEALRLPAVCGGCSLRALCPVCAASAAGEKLDERGAPAFLCRLAEASFAHLQARCAALEAQATPEAQAADRLP